LHNHPPHIKNATGFNASTVVAAAATAAAPTTSESMGLPLSNQIPNMTVTGMINQQHHQQMNANMNFSIQPNVNVGHSNNNNSFTSILDAPLTDMDPSSILGQLASGCTVSMTSILDDPIDNHNSNLQQRTAPMSVDSIHDIPISSSNN